MKKIFLFFSLISTSIFSQTFVSDGSWKGEYHHSATGGTAWMLPGFDDSGWLPISCPNAHNGIPVVSGTQSIWVDNPASYLQNEDTAYMRKTFSVVVADSYNMSITINADDRFQVFVNGVFVGSANSWPTGPHTYNITPNLVNCNNTSTDNVIAVMATNAACPSCPASVGGNPAGASCKATITPINPLGTPVATPSSNGNCTSFDANWNTVATADHYLLDVSDDPNFTTFFNVYHDFNTGNVLTQNVSGLDPSKTYYYRLRAVRGTLNSCYSNSISVSSSIIVSATSATICNGDSATLTASGGTSYTWSAGAISTGGNGSIAKAAPNSTTPYIVTGTTSGCSDTALANVTVISLPDVKVNSPAVCKGQSANLTASGANTYTWSAGAATTGVSTATVNTPSATATYTVTGTNTTTGCKNTAVSTVTVDTLPIITVTSPSVCLGQTASLTASGADTYTWSSGADSTGINTASITPSAIGTFTLTVTGKFTTTGCINTSVATITTEQVIADFNISSTEVSLQDPLVSFTNTSSGSTSWFWNFGNGDTSNLENPKYTYTKEGTYTVWLHVTNALGCSDSISYTVIVKDLLAFFVPNAFTPGSNGVNDTFRPYANDALKNYDFKIFNRWGNLIFQSTDINEGWNGALNNKGEVLELGTYVYQISYTGKKTNEQKKLIGSVTLVK